MKRLRLYKLNSVFIYSQKLLSRSLLKKQKGTVYFECFFVFLFVFFLFFLFLFFFLFYCGSQHCLLFFTTNIHLGFCYEIIIKPSFVTYKVIRVWNLRLLMVSNFNHVNSRTGSNRLFP